MYQPYIDYISQLQVLAAQYHVGLPQEMVFWGVAGFMAIFLMARGLHSILSSLFSKKPEKGYLGLKFLRMVEKAVARNNVDLAAARWPFEGTNLSMLIDPLRKGEKQVIDGPERENVSFMPLHAVVVDKGRVKEVAPRGYLERYPLYEAEVDPSLHINVMLGRMFIHRVEGPNHIQEDMFPYAHEEGGTKYFSLVHFTTCAYNGRKGLNDPYVLDRFAKLGLRPATFLELAFFGGHLRRFLDGQFEKSDIVALGSFVEKKKTPKKLKLREKIVSMFRKSPVKMIKHYPRLTCGGDDEYYQVQLTSCDRDDWPENYLFLGVHL